MTEESTREKIVCVEGKIYRNSYNELIDQHAAGVCSIFVHYNKTKKKNNNNNNKNNNKMEKVNIESIITDFMQSIEIL